MLHSLIYSFPYFFYFLKYRIAGPKSSLLHLSWHYTSSEDRCSDEDFGPIILYFRNGRNIEKNIEENVI